MSFIKFLRTTVSDMPQTITDGFLYIVRSTRSVFFDYDNQRIRLNPPANWNETNTQDPAYIANKPTTISGYGITDAYTKTEMNTSLNNKVDKVSGKVLSTNDYTTAEKNKLAGIATGAEVNVNADWTATSGDAQILHKPTTLEGYGVEDEVESKVEGYSEYGVDTAEGNPVNLVTKTPQKAKHTVIDFEPIQDLHGYDHPWPGGGGKNLLPMTVEGIKENNTNGTWNGNIFTRGNVTYTVLTDSSGNITGILINGTSNVTTYFAVAVNVSLPQNNYVLNGCPSGGANTSYMLYAESPQRDDTGAGVDINYSGTFAVRILIINGTTCNNLLFKPMIRLATESDSTFAPYSNICPISGVDKVEVDARYSLAKLSYIGPYDTDGTILNVTTTYVSTNVVPCSPSTQYTVSSSYDITQVFVVSWDNQGQFIARDIVYNSTAIKQYTFTTRNNAAKLGITIRYTFTITSLDSVGNFQLEKGSEATSYIEPHITKLDLPETVYGGTLDLESGELVVNKGMVDGGSLTWTAWTENMFYATQDDKTALDKKDIQSSCYNTAVTGDKYIRCYIDNDNQKKNIYIKDTAYAQNTSGAKALKASLVGQQIIYRLATPITYHLTPAQLELFRGTNNISTNAKKLTVTYNKGELALIEDIYHEVSTFEQKSEASNLITIETDSAQYAKATHLTIEPMQDLHGYDHPWPGGGGKNLLPMTVEGIKAANSLLTWSGNSCTYRDVTFTLKSLDGVSVSAISLSGTSSGTIQFFITQNTVFPQGDLLYSGQGGSHNAIEFAVGGIDSSYGPDKSFSSDGTTARNTWLYINNGTNTNNVTIYPMIRLASISDSTFAPYSNICPITPMGHRNLLPMTVEGIKAANTSGTWSGNKYTSKGVSFTILTDGDGRITGIRADGTASAQATLFTDSLFKSTSGVSYIFNGCPNGGGSNTYRIGWGYHGYDQGSGLITNGSDDSRQIALEVYNGYTANNLIFKPMIRLASDPESSFVPYGVSKIGVKAVGKNLFDISKVITNIGRVVNNNNGTISVTTPSTSVTTIASKPNTLSDYAKLEVGKTYTLSAISSQTNRNYIYLQGVNTLWNFGSALTITNEMLNSIVNFYAEEGTTSTISNIQIEEGSIATSYEPYTSSSSSITLPEDVYSGTLDMESGELVIDKGVAVFDGSSDENWALSGNNLRGNIVPIIPAKSAVSDNYPDEYLISNSFRTVSSGRTYNGEVGVSLNTGGAINISYGDGTLTLASLRSKLSSNPVQVLYKLASPITYHLTPQQLDLFKGVNNISTNAKTIQVTYNKGKLALIEDTFNQFKIEDVKRQEIKEAINARLSGAKVYGVLWDKTSSAMTRLFDAADITTNTTNFVYSGSVNPNYYNPFDGIYPWSECKQCNVNLSTYRSLAPEDDIRKAVVAWYGDSSFKTDGTNGFVGRYTPEFWYYGYEDERGKVILITDRALPGYLHHKASIRGHGFCVDDGNGGVTCDDGQPLTNVACSTIHSRATGSGITLMDIYELDAEIALYCVEFADYNAQSKLGNGCDSCYTQPSTTLPEAGTDSLTVKLPISMKSYCIPGATLDFGASSGAVVVENRRSVVSVVDVDSSYINVTLNSPLTYTTSMYASVHGKNNADSIGNKSGYVGINGKNNAWYRGAITYANRWQYVLGAYRQTGTNHLWLSAEGDCDDYDAIDTAHHIDTGITIYTPSSNSYQNVGDVGTPHGLASFGPIIKAASITGDQQYVVLTSVANTVLCFGGRAAAGANCGVLCAAWDIPAGASDWYASAIPLLKTKQQPKLSNILGDFAPIEQKTATTNHAIGDYMIIGDKLMKATSAIAAGETITSSNASQTNVAAEFGSVNILLNKLMPSATAGAHNGIYRGKDISSYFSDGSLWSRINGTSGYTLFEDLYVGDYIVINGRSYTIVDFDYYIRCGDTDFNTHHLVMMPTGTMSIPAGTVLYNPNTSATQETLTFINTENAGVTVTYQETATSFKWNSTMADPNTHSTNGGYKYSRMRTVIMRAADTIVIGDFGASHMKAINPIYPNPSDANASGLASGLAWFNNTDWTNPLRKSICDLPNETQVYGQQVWGRGSAYTNVGYEVGVDKFQFAIFALHRNFANIRSNWWLRSVYSASSAIFVADYGYDTTGSSAYAFTVRPRFIIS